MRHLFTLLFACFAALGARAQSIYWISDCSTTQTFCLNQGSCTQGKVNITALADGGCNALSYSYKIDLNNDGFNDINNGSGNSIDMDFAKGTHRITWKANDGCAHVSTCTQLVTVKDCNSPNLICINGLTQGLEAPNCTQDFVADFFILSLSDNCTPTDQIQIGIRKQGEGTGFPTGTEVSFGECDLGTNVLELWAKDGNGLTNKCFVYVLVQAGNSGCACDPDGDLTLRGCARTINGQRAGSLEYQITAQSTGGVTTPINKTLTQTDPDSCFEIPINHLPFGGNYRIRLEALRNENPLNGVSTFDLLLISKHILGADTFQTIYKSAAADVNNSKSVTTFDILEIRKLILGIYDTFPDVPAWRFARPAANPNNLAGLGQVKFFQEFTLANLSSDTTINNLDLIAIKSGDVNGNASPYFAAPPDDRARLLLTAADRRLRAGETAEVPIFFSENARLSGWQMALRFAPAALQIEAIEPGRAAAGFSPENFAIAPDGLLRALWFDAERSHDFAPNEAVISLKIKALRDGMLADALWLDEAVLVPEAYPSAEQSPRRMAFQWATEPTSSAQFFAPRPNPFAAKTQFGFHSETPSEAVLEIFDATGRRVFQQKSILETGYQTLGFPAENLPSAGIYLYRATLGSAVFSGKIVRE